MEDATERAATDPSCARITWTGFHAAGCLLLWLSGNWPSWSTGGWPFYVLLILTATLYATAALMDPGYLPDDDLQPQVHHGLAAAASPLLDLQPCAHCRARPMARAKHCFDCGRCVRRMDHHCWWLGNCVGFANHRIFICYLVCQAMLICTFGLLVAHGAGLSPTPLGPVSWLSGLGSAGCVVLSSVLGLLSVSLLLFQFGLIARGETTWEHLRRERINAAAKLPPGLRPYDRGPARNCLSFLLGWPSPPMSAIAPLPTTSEAPWLGACAPCANAGPTSCCNTGGEGARFGL
mmetsp:Transcript_1033/g.2850  ORF Transcript_1033/g.2850 Transcript_1033/m.2850 type:complete len:292 (+) Transcript_1033:51-926(+)